VPCLYLPAMRFVRTRDRATEHVQERFSRAVFN